MWLGHESAHLNKELSSTRTSTITTIITITIAATGRKIATCGWIFSRAAAAFVATAAVPGAYAEATEATTTTRVMATSRTIGLQERATLSIRTILATLPLMRRRNAFCSFGRAAMSSYRELTGWLRKSKIFA